MTIITKDIGGDGDPVRGYVKFQIDYDNVNLRLIALRCINNSTEACWGQATKISNGRSYDMRFPPSSTTYIAIPTAPSTRLEITIDARNRVDGVEYHFVWPYP